MEGLQDLIAALNKQADAIEALAGEKQKSAFTATHATTQFPRGVGSLWGGAPIERDVITAHVTPQGLGAILPVFPSVVENPFFGILTGFSGDIGSEATNPCDPNPSGYVKACTTTAQFGRIARDTNVIDIDKVMLQLNRGETNDIVLRGRLLGMTGFEDLTSPAAALNTVTKAEMVIAAVNVERKLAKQLWQGNIANNTAGGGYKEMPGLDSQIATGHVDAITNVACPAVDSDVKNFGYDLVDGSGRDIVEYLSMLEFYLQNNARKMGLDPVQWVVVMRPELWFELSAVWPCAYLSNRCNVGDSNAVVINDNVNVNMRDEMRNGRFIDINGNRYPVVIDDGIFEHDSTNNVNLEPGQYASSIYMVPLTITGGFPVTYLEHVNYRAAQSDIALLNGKERFWTDGGKYMWVVEQNRFCYLLSVKTEQRVVLRTPHLAGKIDAVAYSPLQHLRSFDPASPYHADGGVSMRANPFGSINAAWN